MAGEGAPTQETLDPRTTSEWNCEFVNYKGDSAELSGIIKGMSIFESIYNNCMFGNIAIEDGTGMVEANGIVGSGLEEVHFDITTPNTASVKTSNLEKEMKIDSISSGTKTSKTTRYNIGISSPYLFINNKKLISRSFQKMTASEIAEYVGMNIMDFGAFLWTDFTVSPSLHEKNMVVPNWNSFHLLNFLAKNSVSEKGESNYVFFENNDGFKFVTVDELKGGDIMRAFTLKNMPTKIVDDPRGFTVDSAMMDKYVEQSRFNISSGQVNGQYGSSLLAHDILKKELFQYEVEYDGEKDKVIAEGIGLNGPKDSPYKDYNVWQHNGFMSHNYLYNIHDKGEKSHYPHYDMRMTEMQANTIKFDVPGDSNCWAGDVVMLRIPTHIHVHDVPEDQYMTGKWLVTAIHHKISNAGYTMTLECMKDGFFGDPDKVIEERS
ncbi:MAG: hypothetical protein VYD30_05880 [Chloroflexota bacterium]|nr:hypothetical protein [Chloroflexota bacterium]